MRPITVALPRKHPQKRRDGYVTNRLWEKTCCPYLIRLFRPMRFLVRAAYWLVLISALLFFPVLQVSDAMPEPFDSVWLLIVLAVAVLAIAIATAQHRSIHVMAISVLILIGSFFFLRNQGYLPEPPNSVDRSILQHTRELLADEQRWDRSDSRECERSSSRVTLYCALYQASYQVTGTFRSRRPSLQVVRQMIEEHWPKRNYQHRLAGFNADQQVSFADLQQLLEISLAEIDARIARNPN